MYFNFERDSRTRLFVKGFVVTGVIVLILLSVYDINQISASNVTTIYDFSSVWDYHSYKQNLVPIPVQNLPSNKFIYVSGFSNSPRSILIDFRNNSRPSCHVPLNLTYNSISNRDAVSLGNGKILATLLNNQVTRLHPINAAIKVEWKVVIIEPENCTYKDLTVAGPSHKLVQVLPYESSFDVLLMNVNEAAGPKSTKVFRYTDQGERVQKFSAVVPDDEYYRIVMAKRYEPEEGYYYIRPLIDSTKSVVEKLNAGYAKIASYNFNHSQYFKYDDNAYSAEHKYFTVCYFDQENRKNLKCLILDADLKKNIAEVPLNFDYDIQSVVVRNLDEDNVLVITTKKYEERNFFIYAQVIDKNGKVGDSVELGKTADVIQELYTFELKDRVYCVSVTSDEQIMTKCFRRSLSA